MARRKVINSHTFIYTQSRINYVINGHWSTIINPKVATQLWRSVIVAIWRTSPHVIIDINEDHAQYVNAI